MTAPHETDKPAATDPKSQENAPKPSPIKQTLSARTLNLLICPKSGGPLVLDDDRQELISKKAKLAYPINNGVPVLLISEARRLT